MGSLSGQNDKKGLACNGFVRKSREGRYAKEGDVSTFHSSHVSALRVGLFVRRVNVVT